uniref:C-type lectin domain-containing protein n=1 Tax=Cyclopterus lumpus TaxID=8103 RepID=A0A8C2ZFQ9_CYCLU
KIQSSRLPRVCSPSKLHRRVLAHNLVYGIVPVDNMMRTICLLLPLLLIFPAVSEGAQGLRNVIYRYSDRMMNWTEAQTFCRKAHTDLVTINSAEENLNLSNEKGWIGLYHEGSNKVWNWSRRGETITVLLSTSMKINGIALAVARPTVSYATTRGWFW